MHLGYNTNGMAHHDLLEAVRVLAEIGYRSVAITIDHGALSPKAADWREQLAALRKLLDEFGLRSVIETGARFLLDPWRKHEPTLVSAHPEARARRVAFYRHALRCAAELRSDCVSLWSGVVRDGASHREALERLAEGLSAVLETARTEGVPIGFEPEPDMLISSMSTFSELLARLDDPLLRLTLDVGHLHCQQETPLADQIRKWGPKLVNVHLEDMRAGIHEHLQFGDGEIDFPPVLAALAQAEYAGGIHVELSRHSHEGPQAARVAYEFLTPLVKKTEASHG